MMKSDEKILHETVGCENPFRVPEGYFNALPQRVNRRLHPRSTFHWWYAVAASVIVALCVWGLWPEPVKTESADVLAQASEQVSLSGDDLEYELLTNADIAYYLTEVDY